MSRLLSLLCVSICCQTCCLTLNPSHFILETHEFPEDDRFRPAIGNGHVATNVLSDTVYMNGVMNGNGSESHRARIPATSSVDVVDDVNSTRHYALDMLNGIFTQTITRDDAEIRFRYMAHRSFSRLFVTVITVIRRNTQGDITLNLSVNSGEQSEDFEDFETIHQNESLVVSTATIKEPEVPGTEKTRIYQYYTPVPRRVVLEAGKERLTSAYITSTSTEQTDAELAYQTTIGMSIKKLVHIHSEAWRDLWEEGYVEVNGDLDLARSLNAGLYYILSSTPLVSDPISPFKGLSPGGLSRGGLPFVNKTSPYNDYLGHVFWDMDTWILPPIMAFHPQLASIMIGSRSSVLPTVREHANETGYEGARFPWEQGVSGGEVCPWPPATEYQIHVTADVSLALRQYLYATDDVTILTQRKGLDLAMDIARFWKSRVVKNQGDMFEIHGVMGPDEYHFNIDNSVFTNYNAKLSLQLPAYIKEKYRPYLTDSEESEIKMFSEIGEKMLILYDSENKYHPQFEGFMLNESIKQSDVVLLGFPLMMKMTPEVRRNDLVIYENLTDQFGPDTGTWSMHTLTRLELDEEDEAADDFRMMFRNINGPFKVFSEKPPNNPQGVRAVNFITGAGGLLQAVIFGYGGIRLHSGHLEIRPHLLPKWTEWALRGLHYRGFRLDVEIIVSKIRISVLNEKKDAYVYLSDTDSEGEVMKIGVPVERPFSKFTLIVKELSPSTACVFSTKAMCAEPQYLLETDEFPQDDRFRPAIGNGHVATNILSDTVYMNGVMNGNGSQSHRARIPATSSVDVIDSGIRTRRHYSLDMKTGIFTQTITRTDAEIHLQYFAHRSLSRLLVTVVTVTRRHQQGDITLHLSVNSGEPSDDLEAMTVFQENDHIRGIHTTIKEPEVPGTEKTRIYQYYTPVPRRVVLEAGKERLTSAYITSISTEQTDAELAYQKATGMSIEDLIHTHSEAWRDVWEEGHVEVSGDLDLGRTLNAGLYYILSSTPLVSDPISPFKGLSPGGLSRGGKPFPKKTSPYNDYLGHVFWDMDTWILPPIMAFHPQLASIMIGSRSRTLPTVRKHANETGYKGARFPWEQGVSGGEVCPWPPATEYQIHVTAEVSLALRQYLYATDDVTILTERNGLELAMDIARFWKSRVVKNQDDMFEIRGVMGPDEYHFNIDNSVFTNYNAKLSLQLPAHIIDTYNLITTEEEKEEIRSFSDIGEKMLILFDEEKQYHPQFQGFYLNESIKQSDVVLLGFPLMMKMTPEVRRNDLLIYENLTDQFGPDTGTWSMHTLTRLELDEEDEAADDFRMMFRNINGPFKVFSEKPPNNPQGVRAVNFITGAGGLLQAVIFGYGGIRLHSGHLEIRPHLLPKITEWALRGLHYRGFRLDLEIKFKSFVLTLTKAPSGKILHVKDERNSPRILMLGQQEELELSEKIQISASPQSPTLSACVFSSSTTCPDPSYLLETDEFPDDDRFRPAIGNGHVATNALSDTVYMNGVMNGNGSQSHRARIPATSSVDVIDSGIGTRRHYSLDMKTGIFTQTITRTDAEIHLQYLAHRTLSRLLVTVLTVTRGHQQGDITLHLALNSGERSQDFEEPIIVHENNFQRVRKMTIRTPEVEGANKTTIIQYYTPMPDKVVLVSGKNTFTSVFITSTGTDETDVKSSYQKALLMKAEDILESHEKAWRDVWDEGHLEVEGDVDLARTLNAGLYYILSSLPLEVDDLQPFTGLSPGGLSRGGKPFPKKHSPYNDYLGHVFWDMDTWILPPIMAFHPQLASIMIGSRTRALPAVRKHAIETGYKGARFPWEQGESGGEVCPWPPATEYQIHVTAEVSLALRQYLYATDDVTILTERKGLELAMDIARFWKSRVVKNQDDMFEIRGVMGPDEYHFNIDNSVFTNYNAKLSLQLPAHIRDAYDLSLDGPMKDEIQEFYNIGANMLILFDEEKQYHPQFQGFYLNESIKQSDVVLLGFPLMMKMTPEVRRNDLVIYENLTDQFGPDTGTWSMHTLTRLELDEEDEAADDFRMMFRNINGPFKVFSEKPPNNPQGVRAVNFITGAGGLLQAVIFGYGGIRLHSGHLEIRPHLLPKITEWALRGLHYRGFRLDLEMKPSTFRLTPLNDQDDVHLYIEEEDGEGEMFGTGQIIERSYFTTLKIFVKKTETPVKPQIQRETSTAEKSSFTRSLLITGLSLAFLFL